MHFLDVAVIGLYFAFIAYVGYRTGRGNKGLDDFFLARRSMPWYVIGLSVMATQASAITLVGTTGQAYVDGMRFVQLYFGLPLAMVILCFTLVPFFYRARVFTAYEFLEKRFDGKTRSLTSFLFLLGRGLSDAVAADLVATKHPPRLATLDLANNPIGPNARQALRDRFGEDVCLFDRWEPPI